MKSKFEPKVAAGRLQEMNGLLDSLSRSKAAGNLDQFG
jgi:hypothetical protein